MKLAALQAAIGHRFSRPELLEQALTHRSFGSPHNERLEFLGDSVLNCAAAIALFERFGELREGDMSRLRANLVRQEALHRLADGLRLGDFLRLGEGELKSGGHRRPSILADALEAIFAAVFLDAGFEAAKGVIDRLYAPSIEQLDPARALKDPKTALAAGSLSWFAALGFAPNGDVPVATAVCFLAGLVLVAVAPRSSVTAEVGVGAELGRQHQAGDSDQQP